MIESAAVPSLTAWVPTPDLPNMRLCDLPSANGAEQGYEVNERGRISNDIREAYAAAH